MKPRNKERPNKKHFLETRLNGIKHRLNKAFRYKRQRQTEKQKKLEIECAFLIRRIETYGFGFCANHYLHDDIDKLEEIVNTLVKS